MCLPKVPRSWAARSRELLWHMAEFFLSSKSVCFILRSQERPPETTTFLMNLHPPRQHRCCPSWGLEGDRGRRACTFAEREKDVLLCGCLSAACLLVSSDTQEG